MTKQAVGEFRLFKGLWSSLDTYGQTSRTKQVHLNIRGSIGNIGLFGKKGVIRSVAIQDEGGHAVNKKTSSGNNIDPEMLGHMHLK